MADEDVDILLRLRNLQSFISGTERASQKVEGIGTAARRGSTVAIAAARRVPGVVGLIGRAAETTAVGVVRAGGRIARTFVGIASAAGRAARVVRERMSAIRSAMSRPMRTGGGGLGGLLLGTALTFASVAGVKNAINFTQELGVQSATTSKIMGTSTQTMAEYFALAQAHGVNIRTLSMSFRAMATQINGFNQHNKTSVGLFKSMGISMKDVKATGGDMNSVMQLVLDRLAKMPGGAAKTYAATRLLGRGWQTLMPFLGQGTKHLRDQMKMARDLGIVMSGNPVKAAMQLHDAQIKLKLAGMGLQIFLATKLVPAFLWVIGKVMLLYKWLRVQLGPAFKEISDIVKSVSRWLSQHKDVLDAVKQSLGILLPYLIAFKVAMILINIVMDANPFVLIALAIIALVAGFIYAWKHSKTFRDTLKQVWADVKTAFNDAWHVINNVWHWIAGAANWAWTNVLRPVFNFIRGFIRDIVVPAFKIAWGMAKIMWTVISTGAQVTWAILKPIFALIVGIIKNVVIPAFQLMWTLTKPVFDAITGAISWAWNNVIKPIFTLIKDAIGPIGKAFQWLGSTVQDVASWIGSALSWAYNNVIKPIMEGIKWVIDHAKDAANALSNIGGSGFGPIDLIPGVALRHLGGGQHGLWSGGGGVAVVGEQGPEIVRLPGASQVVPMSKARRNDIEKLDRGVMSSLRLEVPVIIDRREIARANARFVDDAGARR